MTSKNRVKNRWLNSIGSCGDGLPRVTSRAYVALPPYYEEQDLQLLPAYTGSGSIAGAFEDDQHNRWPGSPATKAWKTW